jgi:hypothetical protein
MLKKAGGCKETGRTKVLRKERKGAKGGKARNVKGRSGKESGKKRDDNERRKEKREKSKSRFFSPQSKEQGQQKDPLFDHIGYFL